MGSTENASADSAQEQKCVEPIAGTSHQLTSHLFHSARGPHEGADENPPRIPLDPGDRTMTLNLRNTNGNRTELDRFFNNFFEGAAEQSRAPRTWTPRTDVTENPHGYQLTFEIPGFSEDQVEITVEEGQLNVVGTAAETPK